VSFFAQALIVWSERETRQPSLFSQHLIWDQIVEKHRDRAVFKQHLQMSPDSFHKFRWYIEPSLAIDEQMAWLCGGPILPELRLYCPLRCLAGGSYSDIYMYVGVSRSSFYCICWQIIFALYDCEKLKILFPQTNKRSGECLHLNQPWRSNCKLCRSHLWISSSYRGSTQISHWECSFLFFRSLSAIWS
jgi:hypothetical protein